MEGAEQNFHDRPQPFIKITITLHMRKGSNNMGRKKIMEGH
jgi:hypothetical protein